MWQGRVLAAWLICRFQKLQKYHLNTLLDLEYIEQTLLDFEHCFLYYLQARLTRKTTPASQEPTSDLRETPPQSVTPPLPPWHATPFFGDLPHLHLRHLRHQGSRHLLRQE